MHRTTNERTHQKRESVECIALDGDNSHSDMTLREKPLRENSRSAAI